MTASLSRHTGRLAGLLLGLLLTIGIVPAWGGNGRITGRITDEATGRPLVGVNVVLIERWQNEVAVEISAPQGAFTDANGYYTILNVSPGWYNLRATMIGYRAVVETRLRVNLDRNTVVDVAMRMEVLQGEEVVVEAELPVVKPDVYGTVETITTERIAQAPFERIDEFIDKMKGIELTDDASGHGLSIRGGDIRETDIMIDNISLRDVRSENSYLNLNTAAVEEIQIKTGGFEARYGGIMSGLVNVITKEGSRDRFSLNLEIDQRPAGQPRFFGTNPRGEDSFIHQVFAGDYSFEGVPDSINGVPVPEEDMFKQFRGWSYRRALPKQLNPYQRRQLWELQHPTAGVATRPDYFMQGALTGPLPGARLPFLGWYAEKTTFLLGAKYESTQYAFTLGARDNYEDWNAQVKLTTRFSPRTKLTLNYMYARISTINEGRSTTYGGALIDGSARFNYLSNTESSIRRQAGLINYVNLNMLFNQSRFQFFDKQFIIGGIALNHSLSPTSYLTLELNYNYTDNQLRPYFSDPDEIQNWIFFPLDSTRFIDADSNFAESRFQSYTDSVFHTYLQNHPGSEFDPDSVDKSLLYVAYRYINGSPNGRSSNTKDMQNNFVMYSHTPGKDSSFSQVYQFRGEYVNEINENHKLDTGFDLRLHDIFVYSGDGWSMTSFPPSRFQYYHVKPIELGLYVQDALTFQGFIATLGLRAEYFHAMRSAYEVSVPPDSGYLEMYSYYDQLPGDLDSYQRWRTYREALADPSAWPRKRTTGKFMLSPRLGASFPVSDRSKLYFNYGYFYQRAPIAFLYNMNLFGRIPTPDLDFEKTTAFEFGYEQSFLRGYLFNVTFYYKDVQNRPLPKTYSNYYGDIQIYTYASDGYRDIRGLEARLEKNFGRFFTFWANYDYQVFSSGQTGLALVHENQLLAHLQERETREYDPQAVPEFNASIGLHTPRDWGPELLGIHLLGGYLTNFQIEWRDGGVIILNPTEPFYRQKRIEVVDYFNVDMRASKTFLDGRAELVLTVKNLLNLKRLYTGNLVFGQRTDYMNSLRLPFKAGADKGNDKWGEYDWIADLDNENLSNFDKLVNALAHYSWGDNSHIETGWYEAPIFLEPRRITLGLRIRF